MQVVVCGRKDILLAPSVHDFFTMHLIAADKIPDNITLLGITNRIRYTGNESSPVKFT